MNLMNLMNIQKCVFAVALFVSSFSSIALAGGEGIGGGFGVDCPGKNLQVYEEWYARNILKTNIDRTLVDKNEKQLKAHFMRSSRSGFYIEVLEMLKRLRKGLYDDMSAPANGTIEIVRAQEFTIPRDSRPIRICNKGKIAPLAQMFDGPFKRFHLYLNIRFFRELDRASKFTLLLHEAVYRVLRDEYSVTDSRLAVHITACLISDTPCPELNAGHALPDPKKVYRCKVPDYDWNERSEFRYSSHAKILLHEVEPKHWRFQVVKFGRATPPTKSYFDLWGEFTVERDGRLSTRASFRRMRVDLISSENQVRNVALQPKYVINNSAGLVRLNGTTLHCR